MASSQPGEEAGAGTAGNTTPRIPINASVLNPRIQESPKTKRFCPCPSVCAANPATLTGPCASNPATLTGQQGGGLPPSGLNAQAVDGAAEQNTTPTPRKRSWFKRPFSSKASQLESPRGNPPSLASPRPEPVQPAPAVPPTDPVQPLPSPTGAIPIGYTSSQASIRYQSAQNAGATPSSGVTPAAATTAPPPARPPPPSYMPSPRPIAPPQTATKGSIPASTPAPAPPPARVMAAIPTPAPPARVAEPIPPAPTSYQLGPGSGLQDAIAPISEEIGQLQQQLQLLSTSLNQLATGHSAPASNQPGAFPPVSENNMSALMRQLNSLNASIIRLGQGHGTDNNGTVGGAGGPGQSQIQSKIHSGALTAREDVSSPRPPLPPNTAAGSLTQQAPDYSHLKSGESLQSSRAGSLSSQYLHQSMSQPGQAVPLTGRMSSGSGTTSGGKSRLGPASLSGKIRSAGQVGLSADERAAGESDCVDIGGQLSQVMHQLESMKSGDATSKTGSFPDRNLSSDYMERLPGWKAELDSIQQELADYYQGPPRQSSRSSSRRRQRPQGPTPTVAETAPVRSAADKAPSAADKATSDSKLSQRVSVGVHSTGIASQQEQRGTPRVPLSEAEPSSSGQSRMMDNPGSVSKPLLNSGGNASDWNSSTLSVDSSSAPLTPLSLPGAGHNPELTTLNADDAGRFGDDGRRSSARPHSSRQSGQSANIGLVLGHQVPADDVSPFEQAEMEAAKGEPGRGPATWTDDTATIQDASGAVKKHQGGADAWAPCFVTGAQAAGSAAAAAQKRGQAAEVGQGGDLGLLNLDTANSSFLQEASAQSARGKQAAEADFLVTAESQPQQNNLLTMSSATESWVMRFKDGGERKGGEPGVGGRSSVGASEDGSHGSMSDAGRRINSIEAHLEELKASGFDLSKGSDSDREEMARLLLQGGAVSDAQAAADLAWVAGLRREARTGARRRASAPTHGAAVAMHGGKPRFTRVRPPTVHLSSDTPTLGSRRMFLTGGSVGGGTSSGEKSVSKGIGGRRRKRHGSTDSCDINDGAVSSCVNSVEVDDLVNDSPRPVGFYSQTAAVGAGANPGAQGNMGNLASPGSDTTVKPGVLNPSMQRTAIGMSPRQAGTRNRPLSLGVKPGTTTAERTSAGGSSTISSQSSFPADLSIPSSQPSAGAASSDHLLSSPPVLSDGAPSAKSKSDATSGGSTGHAGGKQSPTDPGTALPTLLSASSSDGSYVDNSPKAQAGSPVNTAEITAQLEQLVVDAAVVRKRSRRLSKCSPRSTGGNYPFAPDSPMSAQGIVKLSTWSPHQFRGDIRSGGTTASADNLFANRAESPARVHSVQVAGGQMGQGTWGTRSTDSLTSTPWLVGRRRFTTRRTGSSSSQNSPSHRAIRQSGLGSERSSQESEDPRAWPTEGGIVLKASQVLAPPSPAPRPDASLEGVGNVSNVTNVPGGNTTAYFMSAAPTQADMDVLVRLEKGELKHPSKTNALGKAVQLQDQELSQVVSVVEDVHSTDAAKDNSIYASTPQSQQQDSGITDMLPVRAESAAVVTDVDAVADSAEGHADLQTGETHDLAYDPHATQSVADSADTAFTATDAGARGLLHLDGPAAGLPAATRSPSHVTLSSPVLATPEKRPTSPDSVRLAAMYYQRVSPASTHSQHTPGTTSPGAVNVPSPSPSSAVGLRASPVSTAPASQPQPLQSASDLIATPVRSAPIRPLTGVTSTPTTSLYSGGVSTPPRMEFTPKSPLLDSADRASLTSPEQHPWTTSPNITAPPPSPELTPSDKHHPRKDTGPSQSDITRAISSMIRSRTPSIYSTQGDTTPTRKSVSRALPMSNVDTDAPKETPTAAGVLTTGQPRPGTALGQLTAQFDASSGEADVYYPADTAARQHDADERPTSPDFIPSCSSFNKPHLQPGAFQTGTQQPARPTPAAFAWDSMLAHPPQLSMMPTGQLAQQREPSRPFAMAPLMAFAQPLSPVSTNTTFTVDSSIVESPMQPVRPSEHAALHSATDTDPTRSSIASGSEAWMSTRGLESSTVDSGTASVPASRRRISFAGRHMSSGASSNSRFSSTHSDLQSSSMLDSSYLASGEGAGREGTPKHKTTSQNPSSLHKSSAQGVAESVEGPVVSAAWAGILMPQRPGTANSGSPSSDTDRAASHKSAEDMHTGNLLAMPDVVLQVPVYEGPELDLMRSMDSTKSSRQVVSPPSDRQGSARLHTPRSAGAHAVSPQAVTAGTPPRPQSQPCEHGPLTTVRGEVSHSPAPSVHSPSTTASQMQRASVVPSLPVVSPRVATTAQVQVRPPPSPGRIPPTPRSTASLSSTPGQQVDPRVQTPSTTATTPRTAPQSGTPSTAPTRSGEPGQTSVQAGSPTSTSRRGRNAIQSTSSDEGGRRLNFEWWQRPEVDRQIGRSPSPALRRTSSQSSQEDDGLRGGRPKRDRSSRRHRHKSRDQQESIATPADSSDTRVDSTSRGRSSLTDYTVNTTQSVSGSTKWEDTQGKLSLMSNLSASQSVTGNMALNAALLSTGDQQLVYTPEGSPSDSAEKPSVKKYSNFVNAAFDMSPGVVSREASSVGGPATPPQLCSAGAGEHSASLSQQQTGTPNTTPSALLSHQSSNDGLPINPTSRLDNGTVTYDNPSYPTGINTGSPGRPELLPGQGIANVQEISSPASPLPQSSASDAETPPMALPNLNLSLDAKFLAMDEGQQEALTTAEKNEHGKVLAQQLKAIMDALGQPCGSPNSGTMPLETLQGLFSGATVSDALTTGQSAAGGPLEDRPTSSHVLDTETLQALLASMATSLDGLKEQTGVSLASMPRTGDDGQLLNSDELNDAVLQSVAPPAKAQQAYASSKYGVPPLRDPESNMHAGIRGSAGGRTSTTSSSPAPSNSPPLSSRYHRHRPLLQSDQSEITSGNSSRSGSRGQLVSFMDGTLPGVPMHHVTMQDPSIGPVHAVVPQGPMSTRPAGSGSGLSFAKSWSAGGSTPSSPAAAAAARGQIRLGAPSSADGTVQVTPSVVVYKTTPRNAQSVERQRPGAGKRDNKCTVQ